jgi:hypothetical protein
MRNERFRERERAEMVGRERHVPAQRVFRGAHLHDARVVEQAGDRKTKLHDLIGRAPHDRRLGQVADHRHRAPSFPLDCVSHFAKPFAVAPDKDDGPVLGEFERRAAPSSRSRPGDDVSVFGRSGGRHFGLL